MDDRPSMRPVLYVITCAAPPARDVGDLVRLAHDAGWQPAVIASPDAIPFIDEAAVAGATGYPVRSRWRRPDESASVPDADALVVGPATFNTLNKWVTGIADTLAVATLCENLGRGVPIVAAPCVNPDLVRHPAFDASLDQLRRWGVSVLYDPDAPRSARMVSWKRIMDEVVGLAGLRAGGGKG